MAPSHRRRPLILVLVLVVSGCYSHRVSTVGTGPDGTPPPATDYEGAVAWTFLWGLVERPAPPPENCQGQALAEVRASSNVAFDVISVVTLGAAVPVRLDWKCARPTPGTGDFPIPTGGDSPRAP
jgi:hypothetical protein